VPRPLAARHHTGTYRVRASEDDAALGVTVLRGVGWRAACSCGWRGRFRRDRADARIDIADHLEGARRD